MNKFFPAKMKNILVTGSTGLLGLHLVKRLKIRKDVKLKVFDHRKHSLEDVDSLIKLVKGSDVVFHLAAINSPGDPDIFKINVIGTANLLDAIALTKTKCRIIYPSTFGVYRNPNENEQIDEKFETLPRNRYGISKLLCEELIKLSISNIKPTILRISNLYGYGDRVGRSVVANFFNKVKNNETIEVYGDGNQTRDFVYVEDVVDAMVKAMDRKDVDDLEIFNICSGKETSINELIGLIGKICKRQPNVVFKEPNESGLGYWRGINKKAVSMLGWKPKITLEKGLRLTSSQ